MHQIKFITKISNINPKYRRLILVIIDIFLICLSVQICSFLLPYDYSYLDNYQLIVSLNLILVILLFYFLTGHYSSLTKYVGSKYFYKLLIRNTSAILVSFLILSIFVDENLIFFVPVIIFVGNGLLGFSKILLRDILIYNLKLVNLNKKKVAIYGCGEAGAQLNLSLRLQGNYDVKFFIDDNKALWNRNLDGIKIYPPRVLQKKHLEIDQIFLAIPSLSKSQLNSILNELESLKILTLQVPCLEELNSKKIDQNILRPISIEDLLGREPILPNVELMKKAIENKVICVTGAGGSIGSELCKQICILNPKKVIFLERNEFALYSLTNKLKKYREKFIPKMLDAKDFVAINNLFKEQNVQVVFHAAAYKHVPLVEDNYVQSLLNNVLSTRVLCEVSFINNIDLMMLISSDKAVRPTNIMGVSKRISELIINSYAKKGKSLKNNKKTKHTLFSMVRFGNVLGSSGSVLPLFQSQIAKGGPVTITHPEIVRYFMSILEATQLVIHSAAMANGEEVFLLDMGEKVRIIDFAKKLIRLSGLSIKDKINPKGDIEIITSGLRPGEKLYEELLIDETAQPTAHPRIFKALKNDNVDNNNFLDEVIQLENFLIKDQGRNSLRIIHKMVPEWKPFKKSYFE